ncbi:MAG: hypothetical protein KKA81_10730 [Bacteroidetes bacterium]|nr:hypothetical protein [Bacteroidota bacterium]
MKIKNYVLTTLSILVLSSCSTTNYYQVYKAKSVENYPIQDDHIVFENDHCRVFYDFWGENGDFSFRVYNKTDEDLYIEMGKSFCVNNGIAYDYYKERVVTYSRSSGVSSAASASGAKSVSGINYYDLLQTNIISLSASTAILTNAGYSVSYGEEKVICIPSGTSKVITEYNINTTLIRSCDLLRFPRKNFESLTYSPENSPIIFSNRIVYKIGSMDESFDFENEFYVSEITNYPETQVIMRRYKEYCGQKSIYTAMFYVNPSPDKFFIKYTKSNDTLKY